MAASSPPPGLVSVSSRESYFETTLQKRAHRPLHSQISTLLAEREELLVKNQELAEKNGELQWRLSQAIEESVAKHADTVETAKQHELIESSFNEYKETSEVFAAAHLEQQRISRDLMVRLKASEAKTRHVLAQLMHSSTALQAERTQCEEIKDARAVEVATLVKDAEAADDELGQLTLLLTTTLGERQWLRDQLATVLRRQLKLKQQLAEERSQRAQLTSDMSTHLTLLDAERAQRHVLGEELTNEQLTIVKLEAALKEAEGRNDELQERLQGAQSKHVAALVQADRADRLLTEERRAMREAVRWQWRLSRNFGEGAKAAEERARVAERMRWSHTSAERCDFVAAGWRELLDKGQQLAMHPALPAAGAAGAAGRSESAALILSNDDDDEFQLEEESVYSAAPSMALASAAGAFVSASLALVRATAPLPSELSTLPSISQTPAAPSDFPSVAAFDLVDVVRRRAGAAVNS